jgi:hypothetical protein
MAIEDAAKGLNSAICLEVWAEDVPPDCKPVGQQQTLGDLLG